MKRSVFVGLALMAASGCGGGQPEAASPPAVAATAVSSPSASPATSPSPSPSPSPTALSKEAAAEQYLAIVKPYNVALNALYDYYGPIGDLSDAELAKCKALAADLADANRAFSLALVDAEWPEDVKDSIDELARVAASSQATIRGMATAKNAEQFYEADAGFEEQNKEGTGAAEFLRQQLGLGETKNTDHD